MRVLVCGGRQYADRDKMDRVLCQIDCTDGPITSLIHGGAGGADALAAGWARDNGLGRYGCVLAFPADWVTYGNAAGPIRNRRMLTEGCPDLVVAFPGNAGTRDMVKQARKAGVKVMEIKP